MAENLSKVGMLTRREIEARIAGPLIKAFVKEFGEEITMEIVGDVIRSLARESGAALAESMKGNSLKHLVKSLSLWSEGGALHYEIVEQSETKLIVHAKNCKYAGMYKNIGLHELGYVLSCGRDFALIEGFNPDMELTRTQTEMEGADYCDFCFELKK